ncbi:MAG: chorismate lyase [Candidatus Nitrotoga sp.]
MRDKFWKTFVLASGSYASWLRDNGSLTARIQQRCKTFSVQTLYSKQMNAVYDETALLELPNNQKIFTREVYLYADSKPVVFAHSVVEGRHLRGAWRRLKNLGVKPLGAVLFAHPMVHRAPLHYSALKPHHVLYRRAVENLGIAPPKLWARRSVFILHGAPLLVTEVFLPDILTLSNNIPKGISDR